MKIKNLTSSVFVISTSFVASAFILSACGGGGGGGAATPNPNSTSAQAFEDDLAKLGSSSVQLSKATNLSIEDQTLVDSFTKVFGSHDPANVQAFIRERIKHVYSVDEVDALPVNIYQRSNSRLIKTATMGSLVGGGPSITEARGGSLQGVNYSGLAQIQYQNPALIVLVTLPDGSQIEAANTRMGLVGLAPGYFKNSNFEIPLEGRIAVLVHEGRHSDCPDGASASNCSFPHMKCTSGNLIGIEACDGITWGSYGVETVYLTSTLENYKAGTAEAVIIDAMKKDKLSRLTSDIIDDMTTTVPNLTSL